MRKKITFKGCPYVGEINKKRIPHGKGVLKILKDSPLTIPSKNWQMYQKKMEKIDEKIQMQRDINAISSKEVDEDLEENKQRLKIIYNPPKQTHMLEGEYSGHFKNGKLHGYGVFKNISEHTQKKEIIYKGQFKDNVFNGKGVIPEYGGFGPAYAGQFKNGLKHGFGTLKWIDYTYVGEFKYDNENGKGTLIKNKKKFKGIYKNGKIFNGKTRIDVKSSNGVYEGDIKNGKITGYGKLWKRDFMNNYKEELVYEGLWHNGNPKYSKPIYIWENLNIHNC
jgi:hypothetical protein